MNACTKKNYTLTFPPETAVVSSGGLIEIQSKDTVIEIRPDQTYTMVGTLPRLPSNPLMKGYMWAKTQKLKKRPPKSLLHCGITLYIVLENPMTTAAMLTIMMLRGMMKRLVHFTT